MTASNRTRFRTRFRTLSSARSSAPPCTRSSAGSPRGRQRGITLFGLLFWAILVGFGGYLLVQTLPTLNEYFTIQRTVEKVAKEQPATVAAARQAFDKQKELEYSISSVSGKDLAITKENDQVVISFAYEKEIPVMGPVYILLKYEGRSK